MSYLKTCVILLALMLAAMAMVPYVSALDDMSSANNISAGRTHASLQNVDLDKIPLAKPMTEPELVTIILPANIITETEVSDEAALIDLTALAPESDKQFSSQADIPNFWIFRELKENDPVTVLRVPAFIYRSLVPDANNVSIPMRYFRTYSSLQEFQKLRAEENRQIQKEIEKVNAEEQKSPAKKTIPVLSSAAPMASGDSGWWISRKNYTAPSGWQIDYEIGKMTLQSYTRTDFGHIIYEEREIGLNRIGSDGYPIDGMEVVASYEPLSSSGTNRINVFPVFYDTDSSPDPIIPVRREVDQSSLPHDFGMHFIVGKGSDAGWYWVSIEDFNPPGGMSRWYGGSYYDSTPSQYIYKMAVSSELGLQPQTTTFNAQTTPIMEEWIRNSDNWYKPFGIYIGPQSEELPPPGKPMRYVSTTANPTSSDGNIYTHAYCQG
jgi:hypothetical protein